MRKEKQALPTKFMHALPHQALAPKQALPLSLKSTFKTKEYTTVKKSNRLFNEIISGINGKTRGQEAQGDSITAEPSVWTVPTIEYPHPRWHIFTFIHAC